MILIFIKQLLTKIVACTTRYVKQPNVGGLNTFFVSDFCIYYTTILYNERCVL